MRLVICHLYPDIMNLYGDRGNVIALDRRARWHGLEPVVVPVSLGDAPDFEKFDLIFMGGGQDREQGLITADLLQAKGPGIKAAVEAGVPLLAICGAYQLLGHYYRTFAGEVLPGLGLFDVRTEAGPTRIIGDVLAESKLSGESRTLVGFENHSGRTFLGPGAVPLGRVLVGGGNNGRDGTEGAVYRNALGTYLHGSLLPKNPWLADYLLGRAVERRRGGVRLARLDDALEDMAHRAAAPGAARRRGGGGGLLGFF
ncbi:MAG: glutamine amidotransferase [Acetobacteraceae bacterium]|nr:glutamine amidotransferase [Acetobacteraceae bacterium]